LVQQNVVRTFVQQNKQIMETLNMILSGTGLGAMAVKSLLLLLLKPDDLFTDEYVKIQIDNFMNTHHDVKNVNEVEKFVTLVYNDKFTIDTLSRNENRLLLINLSTLKDRILKFYFDQLNQIQDESIKMVCDVQTTLDKLFLQLVRFRMVIQPEIQISQNIHPVSKISYIAVKSFWIDDNGEKRREFTRSLGPLEDYGYKTYDKEIVSNNPKVIEESLKRIQEVIYARYKEYYPE